MQVFDLGLPQVRRDDLASTKRKTFWLVGSAVQRRYSVDQQSASVQNDTNRHTSSLCLWECCLVDVSGCFPLPHTNAAWPRALPFVVAAGGAAHAIGRRVKLHTPPQMALNILISLLWPISRLVQASSISGAAFSTYVSLRTSAPSAACAAPPEPAGNCHCVCPDTSTPQAISFAADYPVFVDPSCGLATNLSSASRGGCQCSCMGMKC